MSDVDDQAHAPKLSNDLETDVKMEEGLDADTHSVKAEPDYFLDAETAKDNEEEEGISGEAQANIIAEETLQGATCYDEYAWREALKDANLSEAQIVEIMETAEKQGMDCIMRLRSMLIAVQKDLPEAKRLIRAIDEIRANKQDCRITVGFLGQTGAGKSSFINALLGYINLLPANARKACTAACVEIGWNASNDPDKVFRAEIVCLTAEEWRQEIAALIKDIKDDDQGNDENGRDLWRTDRIKKALDKVKCVYPYIHSQKKLLDTSVDDLLNDDNIKNIFQHGNKTLHLSSPDLESFSSTIRPYIDSNNAMAEEGVTFAFWPLVKVVKLYVKSPLLKDGIFLVDLPGSHDTNAARGALAAQYQKDLNIRCVMACAKRAVSDKTAGDLLGEVQQRTMQLDNQFSSDRLCFILTMTDESIDLEDYIKKSLRVRRQLLDELKREKEGKVTEKAALKYQKEKLEQKSEIQSRLTTLKASRKNLKKAYNPLKFEYESILAKRKFGEEGSTKLKQNSKVALSATQLAEAESLKHQVDSCSEEIKKFDKQRRAAEKALLRAQDKLVESTSFLTHCESMKLRACIKHRNEESAKDIRKYYKDESRAIGRNTKGEANLQVFGVSSASYTKILSGINVPGFKDIDETGVLDVRRWLVAATLGPRKINSSLMLESILSFELSTTPSLADREVGHKMLETMRDKIQELFEKDFEKFEKKFENLNLEATKTCKKDVQQITSKLSQLETDGVNAAPKVVKRWPDKPMHWSTFRAICKNGGCWKRPYARNDGDELHPYDWNEELANLYLNKKLVRWWGTVMTKSLPLSRAKYLWGVKDSTADFVNAIVAMVLDYCPEISAEVDNWKESSLRTFVVIDKKSADIFNTTIQKQSSATHPLVGKNIQKAWMDVYKECGEAKGKNHYAQSQAKHVKQIEEVKQSMYKAGSDAIRESFKELWTKLPEQFEKGTSAVTKQIVEEFELMLDNHTLFGNNDTGDRRHYTTKKKMQVETIEAFKEMKNAWCKRPVFEVEEKKHTPDIPVPTLDGLYDEIKGEDSDDSE